MRAFKHGYPAIKLDDLDAQGGKIVLRDTKNRSGHKLLLSRQALKIARNNKAKRKREEPLFPIVDARKTLAWINAKSGTSMQGHGLRSTFASIAGELVSGAVLKKVMNHAAGAGVTLGHYVGKSEARFRARWRVVADFIEASAAPARTGSTRLQRGPYSRPRPWRRAAVRSTAAAAEPKLTTRDS